MATLAGRVVRSRRVFTPDAVVVERGAEETPMARRCRDAASRRAVHVVDDRRELARRRRRRFRGGQAPSACWRRIAARFSGTVPAGTRGLACCNYLVMNLASNCPMDCGYCFLQEYLADNAAAHGLRESRGGARRAGAGARPPHGPPFPDRHRRARRQPGARSADRAQRRARAVLRGAAERLARAQDQDRRRRGLLALDPKDRVVVSWSLAPPAAVAFAEHGTASIAARLAAARRVVAAGYKVGVHFDPMIEHAGWEEGYRDLVAAVADAVPAARLAWVSMGALRFSPGSSHDACAQRFPGTPLLAGEQVPSADGKWRDFQPLRVDMYRRVRAFVEAALAGGAALSLHGDAGGVAARLRHAAAGRAGARRAALAAALMAAREPGIGIFDSGVGGLTVVHRMIETLPNEHLIYLGDTARYPVRHQVRRGGVALHARERPVPARQGREAAGGRVQHHVGGRARRAPRPHRRARHRRHRARRARRARRDPQPQGRRHRHRGHDRERQLHARAPRPRSRASRSTPAPVRSSWRSPRRAGSRTRSPSRPPRSISRASARAGIDTLVLGCTHYPLLARTIGDYLGPEVQLVDSATETAREVAALLAERGLAAAGGPGSTSFFVTDVPDRFVKIGSRFLGSAVDSAVRIE